MLRSSHSTLTVALAIGFGGAMVAAVSSNPAIGYPTTAVATGTNPVVAMGGVAGPSSTSTILGTFDERLIITDVVLTFYGSGSAPHVCLTPVSVDSGGGELARFHLSSDTNYSSGYLQPNQVSHTYSSGLPVEPGQTVGVTNHGSNCEVAFSVSGYLAQP